MFRSNISLLNMKSSVISTGKLSMIQGLDPGMNSIPGVEAELV
jgi:hypothetical protein